MYGVRYIGYRSDTEKEEKEEENWVGWHVWNCSYLNCAWFAFPYEAMELFTYSLPQDRPVLTFTTFKSSLTEHFNNVFSMTFAKDFSYFDTLCDGSPDLRWAITLIVPLVLSKPACCKSNYQKVQQIKLSKSAVQNIVQHWLNNIFMVKYFLVRVKTKG